LEGLGVEKMESC